MVEGEKVGNEKAREGEEDLGQIHYMKNSKIWEVRTRRKENGIQDEFLVKARCPSGEMSKG